MLNSKYDAAELYPFFQRDGVPLSGEDRLERLFHNFGIALAVNAPRFGTGEWGFPLHYEPTKHTPLFQDMVAPGYTLDYVIFVSSQFGPRKVSVYGFLRK